MYLLETVVVSEFSKRNLHPEAMRWLGTHAHELLYVSVMTIGELERGLIKAKRDDPPFALRLGPWLGKIIRGLGTRVISVDLTVARTWGRLTHERGNTAPDLIIAATALVHDLTVVIRNVRHFDRTGVTLINPYEAGA